MGKFNQFQLLFVCFLILKLSLTAPINLTTGFTLDYQLQDTNGDGTKDTIKFQLVSSSSGYLSIAFGSTMNGATDYIFGYYKSGVAEVKDYTGAGGHGTPTLDAVQDITPITSECSRSGGTTTMVFQRKLNTGDAADKILAIGSTYSIIWARGSTDTIQDHHGNQGSSSLTISDTTTTPPNNNPGTGTGTTTPSTSAAATTSATTTSATTTTTTSTATSGTTTANNTAGTQTTASTNTTVASTSTTNTLQKSSFGQLSRISIGLIVSLLIALV